MQERYVGTIIGVFIYGNSLERDFIEVANQAPNKPKNKAYFKFSKEK